jgi:hypothetical protein
MERIGKVIAAILLSLSLPLAAQFSQVARGGGGLANSGSATVMLTMWETGNVNASNGDVPSRNFYTNCATSCISGVWQPVNTSLVHNGQLACTTAAQTSGVTNGCAARSVVATTLSGNGTHALDNGKGAGGDDSATAMTETYGGSTANPCSALFGGPSGVPGLNYPADIANWMATYALTTDATNFNTSFLGPSKQTMTQAISDAIDHYMGVYCFQVSNVTGGGVHLEFDINHTDHVDNYHGPGTHFNFSTHKLYYCFQGCSSWKAMDIKEANGTVHSTLTWPANNAIFLVMFDHHDPGCTASSSSNCDWQDSACFQDVTAGTAGFCGTLIDEVTGTTPGGIPVLKTGFTKDELNAQTQIDANDNSISVTVKAWKVLVGYHL